jgi:phosphoglycolate phosphatase-like HAD superfamily hydrolase
LSLPSWNDGPARSAIEAYLAGIGEVPVAERVAVFDNDGTLWCEQPAFPQTQFLVDELRTQAAADAGLAADPVVAALLEGGFAAAAAHGLGAVATALLRVHEGQTTEEFAAIAARWYAEARHPRFGVPYTAMTYAPMLELLALLRAHEFRVFIVTGGGVEFVRVVGHALYGVRPDDVVGSAVQVRVERRDGRMVLVREAKLLGSPNEGEPKPVNIQAHIGQRPLVAVGNSAGDREMLEHAEGGERPSLCLVLAHDDAEREYAYAGAAATDPTAEPILDTAKARGWTVVSMRDDWKRVFDHP